MSKLSDQEVVTLLNSKSPLNLARQQFSNWSGKIEQACAQGATPVEMRRMEFEAVQDIVGAFNGE